MTKRPYLPRQLDLLSLRLEGSASPICLTVYDTQGVGPIVEHLTGRTGRYERFHDGVAWFRVSNYLPDGERLVERFRETSSSADWIFLHVGCSHLPDPVLHLLEYIAEQNFDLPRVVVVGETVDVTYGNQNLRTLFSSIGSHIDLRQEELT